MSPRSEEFMVQARERLDDAAVFLAGAPDFLAAVERLLAED